MAELRAITFNHDPESARRDALNIRRNAFEFGAVPEWQHDLPGESVAAYSIEDTRGQTITIQAKLRAVEAASSSLEVRALPAGPPPLPQPWENWLTLLFLVAPLQQTLTRAALQQIWSRIWSSGAEVLGRVKPRRVQFDANGDSDFVSFELEGGDIGIHGIGVHQVGWTWQVRHSDRSPWIGIATTRHRIFTVLTTPSEPWVQTPFTSENTQLPWAEALEVACAWAPAATTAPAAAAQITRSVYELGPELLAYNCAVDSIPAYAPLNIFNCTMFLAHLRTGIANRMVICTDTATIVSSFANLVGCDLWQSRMLTPGIPFPVNPIRSIGNFVFEPPCGFGIFAYHEVAWTGEATLRDRIFDACLQVNASPPFRPIVGEQPVDMRFGLPGDGGYRDHLATPAGRLLCDPHPETRIRRTIV